MNEDTFLSVLHDSPNDEVSWLALADWLDDEGQVERAELVRLTRKLRNIPVAKRKMARAGIEDRMTSLLNAGIRPLVPEIVNSIGMRLAMVPHGKFRMGSPTSERLRAYDEVTHKVEITKPFYLGVFVVTQIQYERVMEGNSSYFSVSAGGKEKVEGLDTSNHPADSVTWDDAVEFCRRLTERAEEKQHGRVYRLPTEAEWEYACRAGTMTPFHYGAEISSKEANFGTTWPYGKAERTPSLGRTSAVGSYPPNAFGLYDMHGNVWEWCSDFFEWSYYRNSPAVDPTGPAEGRPRVIRGGSWQSSGRYCRSAARVARYGNVRSNQNGLRVAMTVVKA